MSAIDIQLDEGQRQMVLLALAQLARRRPDWDEALNDIALKMDNHVQRAASDGVRPRAELYDGFRAVDPVHANLYAWVATAVVDLKRALNDKDNHMAWRAASALERIGAGLDPKLPGDPEPGAPR